jgi:hypothetical protein
LLVFVDIYGLSEIFSKYNLDLKNEVPKSFQYYFELLAVWMFKALAYVGFAFFAFKTYCIKLKSKKLIEGTVLAWSGVAFIFFSVVLYGISRVWFVAPHSDLLGMVFYLSMFGLFLRGVYQSAKSYDLWRFYKIAMIINLFPVSLSIVTILAMVFDVHGELVVYLADAFWVKNVGFVYLDIANPVLLALITWHLSKEDVENCNFCLYSLE